MTPLQIAAASLDAFVIIAGSSITGNLLAGWLSRWWHRRKQDQAVARLLRGRYEPFGIVRAPMPGGRCEHLRARELCDDCNNNQWAKDFLGDKKGD